MTVKKFTPLQVGSTLKGSQFYGKKNTLTGTVTKIEEVTYEPQPFYRGEDIITVVWDNGVIARFTRSSIHEWENEERSNKMAKAIYREKPRVGDRVEMFDCSHQGTISEVVNPHFLVIKWDDGEEGCVHPNDVRHIIERQNTPGLCVVNGQEAMRHFPAEDY